MTLLVRARGGIGATACCRGAARGAARRGARRRSAGFTLIELMVVVVLIAILAMLAMPSMLTAREDRLAFRSADQFARVIHEGRTRAMARGAAQLIILSGAGVTDRGTALSFESVDATPGKHPISSCKIAGEWAGVPAGNATNLLVGGSNLNCNAVTGVQCPQAVAGIETAISVSGVPTPFVGICFTPGGRVYVVPGADVPTVVGGLPIAAPFTGDLNLAVARKPGGGIPVGLTRNVVMTAAGGTRIRSL